MHFDNDSRLRSAESKADGSLDKKTCSLQRLMSQSTFAAGSDRLSKFASCAKSEKQIYQNVPVWVDEADIIQWRVQCAWGRRDGRGCGQCGVTSSNSAVSAGGGGGSLRLSIQPWQTLYTSAGQICQDSNNICCWLCELCVRLSLETRELGDSHGRYMELILPPHSGTWIE